jgi:hypothetical protein
MSPPKSPTEGDLLDEEDEEEEEEEEAHEADEDTSHDATANTAASIEVFDLPDESSSEAVTPDMDSQVSAHYLCIVITLCSGYVHHALQG